MRLNDEFVDVTLWCENRSIRAHKCILAAGSTYFRQMLKDVPNHSPVIVMNDMRYEDLFAAISYIYDGVARIPSPQAKTFAAAFDTFKLYTDFVETDSVRDVEQKIEAPPGLLAIDVKPQKQVQFQSPVKPNGKYIIDFFDSIKPIKHLFCPVVSMPIMLNAFSFHVISLQCRHRRQHHNLPLRLLLIKNRHHSPMRSTK